MRYKTSGTKRRASQLGIKRDRYHILDDKPDGKVRFYWSVCFEDLKAAAAFTETLEEREYLWGEINKLAASTRRGS